MWRKLLPFSLTRQGSRHPPLHPSCTPFSIREMWWWAFQFCPYRTRSKSPAGSSVHFFWPCLPIWLASAAFYSRVCRKSLWLTGMWCVSRIRMSAWLFLVFEAASSSRRSSRANFLPPGLLSFRDTFCRFDFTSIYEFPFLFRLAVHNQELELFNTFA